MVNNELDKLIEPKVGTSRLMGANLFFPGPGAVLDAILNFTDMSDINKIIELWYQELDRVMTGLNWPDYKAMHKQYSNGIKFAITAPVDLLFVAVLSLQEIWDSAYSLYKTGQTSLIENILDRIMPDLKCDLNLKFRTIFDEAHRRSLNVFCEENNICIGSGINAYRSNIDDIVLEDIPWHDIKEIPTAIVTGTNGKTTTVRLTTYIIRQAQFRVGYCSTDWVMVEDEVIEAGDMSGPVGNLLVMSHPKVEIAVLEAARGGLVRRGLIADFVSVATVTNISEDHLGQDGIETIADLAYVKCLIYNAVKPDGYRVINIDDPELYKQTRSLTGRKIMITRQELSNPNIANVLAEAEYICYTRDNAFYWKSTLNDELIATFIEVPITANGCAQHNIANAMQAICVCFALGLKIKQIRAGLTAYENTVSNNRGRANVFKYNHATIIVDFAHNPAAICAILNMCKTYKSSVGKLFLLIGNTGNRLHMTDSICQVITDAKVDIVMVKELPDFLRGSQLGEIPKIIEDSLISKGIDKENIIMIVSEENALKYILDIIRPGDVCAFLCHSNVSTILEILEERAKPL